MTEQKVEYIKIKDLVLWTENPRDPIDENAIDQDIVNLAMNVHASRWHLPKLAKEMGERYDFSELPTIVYHGKKPVVYDGNRRVILGKIKHQLVKIDSERILTIPEFPYEIPCNVCTKEIALRNILRKHGDSGSWQPLERDIFLHKHMKEGKSAFLVLEESTGLISSNPHLNQRFVKEEIFKDEILKNMGFDTAVGVLRTRHNDEQALSILSDVSKKIQSKTISTRKNRGKVIEVLEPSSREIIDCNRNNKVHEANLSFKSNDAYAKDKLVRKKSKQSSRTKKNEHVLFGGKLYLKKGGANDLYRDINELYQFYINNKSNLSSSFISLIRMSLRLLCEMAAKDCNKKGLDDYLKSNFAQAKHLLDQDFKTTLANHNVTDTSICQLLHTGAHNYQAASNKDQTIAVSIILGAILTITHGKDENI